MTPAHPVEIERKFLVNREQFLQAEPTLTGASIVQGYWHKENLPYFFDQMIGCLRLLMTRSLSDADVQFLQDGGPEVFEMRVRQKDQQHWVTFKSREQQPTGGVLEFETEINGVTAQMFLERADVSLGKKRYELPLEGDLVLEVDLFENLDGLALAEVEIPSLDTPLPTLPAWVGAEVTGDPAYFNRNLSEKVSGPTQHKSSPPKP